MMNHHLGYDKKSNHSWLLMEHFSNPTLTLLTALGILFSVLALV